MSIRKNRAFRFIAAALTCMFSVTTFASEPLRSASLPAPDKLLPVSGAYSFPVMKGVRFNPADPLNLEFIFDSAHEKTVSKEEVMKLVEYFLAGLTIPEEDLWVNLSPYESNRIAPDTLASTDMGTDMLAQDYVLKQLSSSLTYPDSETGREYWNLKSEISDQEFNKIWIVPDSSEMCESDSGTAAFVINAALKAMTEADYVAMQKAGDDTNAVGANGRSPLQETAMSAILPAINRELNEGKNFATLRQIHHSLLLAMWFKAKFKQTFFNSYFNTARTAGIDVTDKDAKDKIYALYCEAFRKGVYDVTRKETITVGEGLASSRKVKRHYFSGGERLSTALTNTRFVGGTMDNVAASFDGKVCSAVVSLADGNTAAAQPFAGSALKHLKEETKDAILVGTVGLLAVAVLIGLRFWMDGEEPLSRYPSRQIEAIINIENAHAVAGQDHFDALQNIVRTFGEIDIDYQRFLADSSGENMTQIWELDQRMIDIDIGRLEHLAEIAGPDVKSLLKETVAEFLEKPYLSQEQKVRLQIVLSRISSSLVSPPGGVNMRGVGASAITPYAGDVNMPAGFDGDLFDGFSVMSISDIRERAVRDLI